ncbi:MAG: hypothetical protein ACOY0T_11345 [Myxococcota bacterium]
MSDEFRTYVVKLVDGHAVLLGRFIGTTPEVYRNKTWEYWPPLVAYLEGNMPWLVEVHESEVPRYMEMIDNRPRLR